ncbi:MAG: cache domain-containing protein, partial [Pseudothermotoga sp.]
MSLDINKRRSRDLDVTKEPPKLADFFEKRIVRAALLLTVTISLALFFAAFHLILRSVQSQKITDVIKLETAWTDRIESFGKLLNLLSTQTKIFKDEECIMNLLQQMYENYQPLITCPTFGRFDGKMFVYPKYEYGLDYDPRKRPWYQAAAQNPESYVLVKPFIHAFLNEPTIAVAKAVYDEDRNLLGVLALDLLASRMAETLLIDRSYIVDETGQILAKKGTIKTAFDPRSVRKEITSGRVGLTGYVVKTSILGTCVVAEYSL